MTGQVTFGCGESASADLSSASVVFAKYCDSKVKVDFSAPATDNVVDAYITDIREIQYLAPCAARGLSGAVMTEVRSCTRGHPTGY